MSEEPRTTNHEPRPEALDPRVRGAVAHFFDEGLFQGLTWFESAVAWQRIGNRLIEASDFRIAAATTLANLMKGCEAFRKCAAGECLTQSHKDTKETAEDGLCGFVASCEKEGGAA
jgi:hypothetical protein